MPPRSPATSRSTWRPPIGIHPSQNSAMSAAVFGPASPPRMIGGLGNCTGFGQAQLGSIETCSPSNVASSSVHNDFMARMFSRRIARRSPVGRAVLAHLLLVPAVSDAEQEPAAGQSVDARHLLGRVDRIALGHETDPGGQFQRRRDRCRSAERDERIVGPAVEVGQRRRALRDRPTASRGSTGCVNARGTRVTRSPGPRPLGRVRSDRSSGRWGRSRRRCACPERTAAERSARNASVVGEFEREVGRSVGQPVTRGNRREVETEPVLVRPHVDTAEGADR